MPELPYSFEAIVNYNHSVYNIHGIHTAPAGLESTCLVLCYGLGNESNTYHLSTVLVLVNTIKYMLFIYLLAEKYFPQR